MKMKSLALAVTLGLGAVVGSQIAYSDSAQDKLMAAAEAGDANAAQPSRRDPKQQHHHWSAIHLTRVRWHPT